MADDAGVPVIVDAAAQLPPVDNLWGFTRRGGRHRLFSGGKALHGPQAVRLDRRLGTNGQGLCDARFSASAAWAALPRSGRRR